MNKKYCLVFMALLYAVVSGFGQTTIWNEDFSSGSYTIPLGGEGNDGSSDYFQKTDGSNIGITYSGFTGNFFAAQDIDDGGWTGSAKPSRLLWSGINISGYTSLEFAGNFASFATDKIDDNDYLIIEYRIDGGLWVNLIAFENDGTAFNTQFGEDTDFDGDSDGTALNASFTTFNKSITSTGSNLDIRITVSVDSGGEDIAFDEFKINGISGSPTCNLSTSGITNISCNDNTTSGDASDDYITFDLNPTGSTLGTNYSVSVSGGSITPTTAAYGSATTFTLQNGSAGAGDVTVTLTDDTDGTCTFDQLITDPGSCASGSCSELFISEYVEGSSNNKYIEIYNPTGASINLANYQLANYSNGNTNPSSTLTLSGTIGSYSTYVIANDQATIYTGTIDLSTNNNVMDFNGDDAIALQTSGGTNIDVIGQKGTDPGSQWGTGLTTTANHTLVRKSTVTSGDNDGSNSFDPSIEWDGYSQDTVSYLGSHTSDCQGPTPELQLTDTTPTDQACGFVLDAGSAETNVSTNDVSFYITNVGSANLEITDLNLPVGDYSIIFPATLPTVGTPLVLAPSGSQLVTVRFAPTVDGSITNTLTITSNDANEGTCTVNLTGEGYTPAANIIVRGVTAGSNPTIPNGSTTAYGFNNTLFAQQTINTTQQTKTYRIGNEGGTAPLTVSNITLTGDTADFSVSSGFTNPFAPDTYQDFTITFQPTTVSGLRQVTVTITNSDSSRNPYTFVVEGTANCPSVSGTITPQEGPIGTEITITSAGNDLTGATATLNGDNLTIISSTTNELVVKIPTSITASGPLPLSVTLTNTCVFSETFTLIDDVISGCDSNSNVTANDLFISQVTDSPRGSLTYVELFNATGTAIDFSTTNYKLRVYNNGVTSTFFELLIDNGTIGTTAPNNTYVIALGITSTQCAITGGDGSLSDEDAGSIGSINFFKKVNNVDNPNIGHDFIGLYDGNSTPNLIDAWGEFGDQTWAVGLGLGNSGANFERKTTATLPSTSFDVSDWDIVNWNDCNDVDYSGIGDYDFSVGAAPIVSSISSTSTSCNTATINVTASESYDEPGDTKNLTFTWYFYNPLQSGLGWQTVADGGIYSGATTNVLSISDTSIVADYQFYCEVREDDQTCFQASNALKADIPTTTWSSTGWSSPPTAGKIAIIDFPYVTGNNTGGQTSFAACSLIVNAGNTLTVSNSTFVNVTNNVVNYGTINVQTKGAFVQQGDGAAAGTFTNSGTSIVNKTTSNFNDYNYHYTYWSSPIVNADPYILFPNAAGNRRYYFDAANFLDDEVETNNNNGTTPGHDDIDDNGDDWQRIENLANPNLMNVGRGFAITATPPPTTPNPLPYNNDAAFSGAFNTGDISMNIEYNGPNGDNDWNLIGNPYPGAISFTDLHSDNASLIDGCAFLWSHASPPLITNNGNEAYNFNQDDYAIINLTGCTAGGSQVIPDPYIPSGQGFFVKALSAGTLTFRNSFRIADNSSNSQFFGPNNLSSKLGNKSPNKLWLSLHSDNGVFNQLMIGYVDGATNKFDGFSYDAPRNLSSTNPSIIYTMIENDDRPFAIQGKDINSISKDEMIPIGFKTSIDLATIYTFSIPKFEGDFLNGNPVYLKDKLLNKIHNLKESDYSFTSEVGEFNDRFEIVFTEEALSVGDVNVDANALQIIELQNGDVQFKVSSPYEMTSIEIVDLLGRTLYKLNAEGNSQTFSLGNLSQAPYLAKVKLSNGFVITKKALKRK